MERKSINDSGRLKSISNLRIKRENQDIIVVTKDMLQSNCELKFLTTNDTVEPCAESPNTEASKVSVNIEEHNTDSFGDLNYSYNELIELDGGNLDNSNVYVSEEPLNEESAGEDYEPQIEKVVCRHETKDKRTVLCHIKTNENKFYKCVHCKFKTDDECELVEHGDCRKKAKFKVKPKTPSHAYEGPYPYDIYDDGPRIYRCSECEFQTIIRARFKEHMRISEHLTDYDTFVAEERLRNRFEMNHPHLLSQDAKADNEPVMYKCGCRFETSDHSKLMKHFQEKHILPKIYNCSKCPFKSLVFARYRDHMKKEHGKVISSPVIIKTKAMKPGTVHTSTPVQAVKAKPLKQVLTNKSPKVPAGNVRYVIANSPVKNRDMKSPKMAEKKSKTTIQKLRIVQGNKVKNFDILQRVNLKELGKNRIGNVSFSPIVKQISQPQLNVTPLVRIKKEKDDDSMSVNNKIRASVSVPNIKLTTPSKNYSIKRERDIAVAGPSRRDTSSDSDKSRDHTYCKLNSNGKDLLQCALETSLSDLDEVHLSIDDDHLTSNQARQFSQEMQHNNEMVEEQLQVLQENPISFDSSQQLENDLSFGDSMNEEAPAPASASAPKMKCFANEPPDVPIVYKCTKCSFVSNNKANFEDHLQSVHNIETFSYKYHIQKVKYDKPITSLISSDQKENQLALLSTSSSGGGTSSKKAPDRIKKVLKNETANLLEQAKRKRKRRSAEQMVYPIIYHCAECNFQTIVQSSFAHHIQTKHYDDSLM